MIFSNGTLACKGCTKERKVSARARRTGRGRECGYGWWLKPQPFVAVIIPLECGHGDDGCVLQIGYTHAVSYDSYVRGK